MERGKKDFLPGRPPCDLTPPVQDGSNDGILVEFVFSMPLFCWSTWRARVNVLLEMLLASIFCSGCTKASAVTLGAGLVSCSTWVF